MLIPKPLQVCVMRNKFGGWNYTLYKESVQIPILLMSDKNLSNLLAEIKRKTKQFIELEEYSKNKLSESKGL